MVGKESLRRARPADAPTVARLHRLVRKACLPWLPDLHTPAEDLDFFRTVVFAECEVWLAGKGSVDGFCAFRPGWVDHLYIRPDRQGRGLGRALMGRAMAANDRLSLWVFQRNRPAIAFYERLGFRLLRRTDGSGNEEREPDALYEWSRPDGGRRP
jgi:GNAT superfamily N-acetyltransferase